MKLSVVVPVFNEKATIAEIIDRIRGTELSIELIVVDDGSTDGTRDILQRVSSKIDHLLLQERNGGKGAALKAKTLSFRMPISNTTRTTTRNC